MATVPVEITWVTGQVVTAAQLNSNVRDAINFLVSPPLAVMVQSAAQSIATGPWTGIALDTHTIDRDGGHSTTVNNSRYTSKTPGWYQVDGNVLHGANATGVRGTALRITNSSMALKVQAQATSQFEAGQHTGGLVYLNTNDFVETVAFQNSGVALNSSIVDGNSRMTISWQSS